MGIGRENYQYQIARYNFIRRAEGYVPYLYLDSRGFLTTGIGYLIARGYATLAEQQRGSIKQLQAISDIDTVVGGLNGVQKKVIDIVAQAISEVQSHHPEYSFPSSGSLSKFLASPLGVLLSQQLEIKWSSEYRTYLISGLKGSDGVVTPVAPVFSDELQNFDALRRFEDRYEALIDKAVKRYGLDISVEQRAALFSIGWNRPASVDAVAMSLASGASDQVLRSTVANYRIQSEQARYDNELRLLREDGSVVPGFDPNARMYSALYGNSRSKVDLVGFISIFPDSIGYGGTIRFVDGEWLSDGTKISSGSLLRYGPDAQVALETSGRSVTLTQTLDPTLGIKIEYKLDAFGRSLGGKLIVGETNAGSAREYDFASSDQIRVASGGGAFMYTQGTLTYYRNLASGPQATPTEVVIDTATNAGFIRSRGANGVMIEQSLPAGTYVAMDGSSGALTVFQPDNAVIKIAAPSLVPQPGSTAPAGYVIEREVSANVFLGSASSRPGVQYLVSRKDGSEAVLAIVPFGARLEGFRSDPTNPYATAFLVTDPASGAQSFVDVASGIEGRFDRLGRGQFTYADGTKVTVDSGAWYLSAFGSPVLYNRDGTVSEVRSVGGQMSVNTYIDPEIRRLASWTQDRLGEQMARDSDGPRVTQIAQTAWSAGLTPIEFSDLIGNQVQQLLGEAASSEFVGAAKSALSQLAETLGEPSDARILSNGTVLLHVDGQRYAVNGADVIRFSIDEFNALTLTPLSGVNAGQSVRYENFVAYAAAHPDGQLGGFIPTAAVLRDMPSSQLASRFSGVEDEGGQLSYSGTVQYSLDADGYILGNQTQNVVAMAHTAAGSLVFDVAWTGDAFEAGAIQSVNGQPVVGGVLRIQDAGLSLRSLTNAGGDSDSPATDVQGSVGASVAALIEGLDPASIVANGWAMPQLDVTPQVTGGFTRTLELGNGASFVSIYNDDRRLVAVDEITARNAFESSIRGYAINADGSRSLRTITSRTVGWDGSYVGTELDVTSAQVYKITGDPDGNTSRVLDEDASTNLQASSVATVVTDLLNFGQTLASASPMAYKFASGLVLANKVLNTDAAGHIVNANFGAVSTVAAGMLSLHNLSNAWKYGDGIAKASATLGTLNFVNQSLIANDALDTFLNGNGLPFGGGGSLGVLPALGLISAIKAHDPIGMAQSAIALVNPGLLYSAGALTPLGWVFVGANILRSVFDDGPPDAWGTANVSFGPGITNYMPQVNATGESFGPDRVRGQLQNTINALQGLIDAHNAVTVDSSQQLGLIPQRMPALNWRASEFADKGFAVTDIDALTGAQRYADLRFDDDGQIFGVDPAGVTPELRAMLRVEGAPDYPALNAYMLNSALARQAIAPLWEVQTARMQELVGDPNAGLTEEERAAKAGLAAAVDAGYIQAHPNDANVGDKRVGHFMPVGIDLDGSGTISVLSIAQTEARGTPVSFDWDGLGYLKRTGWIAEDDGFLVLDRNFNGSVDDATELLSNPLVADPVKGLRSLVAFDANADGRIDASDPVYRQLKVWQDLNQDGDNIGQVALGPFVETVQDETGGVRELRSLADWGIQAIDYNNSRYEFGGASGGVAYRAVATQTLEAEEEGVRYTPVGAGIRIDATHQQPEIVITQVLGEQAVYDQYVLDTAGETIGVPGAELYEDGVPQGYNPDTQGGPITVSISAAQLLGNDTWHNAAGEAGGLVISGVGNASHLGSLALSDDGNIRLTLEVNYHGQAGFDYTVRAPDGEEKTARVNLNVTPVNDVATVRVQLDQRKVYGYGILATGATVGDGFESYWSVSNLQRDAGLPIEQPYATMLGREITYRTEGHGEEMTTVPVFSELKDTSIPKAYFDAAYAKLASAYGNSWDSGPPPSYLEFTMDGIRIRVDADAGTVLHDTPLAIEPVNDGHVTATDPDGAGTFRYEVVSSPLYGELSSFDASTGRFAYTGRRYVEQNVLGEQVQQNATTDDAARNETRFTDYFTVRVHDDSGGYTDQQVGVPHFGPPPDPNISSSGGKKPIAIDLDGNGFQFTDVDDSNVFLDVNGDGWRRRSAWIKPGDGLLAFDRDGNGKIEGIDEIAFVGYAPDQQTDLAALREAFDSNRNGLLDAGDARWRQFGVWQDANSNGVQEAGEFRSLTDMGIASLGLTSDGRFQVVDGQTVHGLALATRTDGATLAVADVTLRYGNQTQLSEVDADGVVVGTSLLSIPAYGGGQEFIGTPDKDLVFGTKGSDRFVMLEGDDVIVDDGGNDVVEAGGGDDLVYTGIDNDIVNAGAGHDTVFTGAGNDLVFGDDAGGAGNDLLMLEDGNDVAFGGGGNDVIGGGLGNDVLSGNAGDDRLFGEDGWDALFGQDGDDELWGMDGNDLLYGEAGNDLLAGGVGADTMEGGAGDDRYEVDSVGDIVTENSGEGADTVHASISYALGDHLENLTLTGDAGFSGTGNAADNRLIGNDGDNLLTGLAGNDLLDGGRGADLLVGGSGDDTYFIDNGGDRVIEAAGEGADTVRSRISLRLAANVENLTLVGVNAINGTGNELNNTLVGNVAANVLDGGAGADLLRGGRGDDTYGVDSRDDVVAEDACEGMDTVLASTSYSLSAHVENLTLIGSAIAATGNELDNLIQGNAGDNLLDGAAGADAMAGGAGDDTYIVDNFADLVTEQADQGTDTVLAAIDWVLGGHLENLTLTGHAVNGTGNEGDNRITGNAQANLLDGAAGADAMAGGAGDDRYVVDDLADLVTEQAGEGDDTVLASVSHVLSDNVENLSLTGHAHINGTGNGLDNGIRGNTGNNLIDGGAGADVMAGGAGDDSYLVDNATDRVIEQADEGRDTVLASVSYGLSANVENLVLTGSADIAAAGNELANTLTGNAGANRLDGAAGADLMAGGAGDDCYFVDNAEDVVVEQAGEGVDTVLAGVSYGLGANAENLTLTGGDDLGATGNELANILVGNSGANLLDGGAGADEMTGGAGDDCYLVDDAGDKVTEWLDGGIDTVLAGIDYVLPQHLESLRLTGVAIAATGNELNNRISGNDLDNLLDGSAGADLMAGGRGNDSYVVDDAGDVVVEQAGEGIDSVLSSVSHTLSAEVENLSLRGTASIAGTGNELNNILIGNSGNNALAGGAGDDTYVYQLGGGLDTIVDSSGTDTLRFGPGLTLDNVALRIVTADGQKRAQIRVLDAAGNELADQGIDYLMGIDAQNRLSSPLENFLFADGSRYGWEDLLVQSTALTGTRNADLLLGGRKDDSMSGGDGRDVLYGGSGHDQLWGGNDSDILFGGGGRDQLHGGNGNDELHGDAGGDELEGGNGDDLLIDLLGDNCFYAGNNDDTVMAGAGNDLVWTDVAGRGAAGNGRDLVQAGAGADRIDTGNEADLVDAGIGDDLVSAGNGDDWIAAGQGHDLVDGGNGRNLYAFNRGDGSDSLSSSGKDVVSLGGGIRYADLTLAKAGDDLVFGLGQGDSMTLKDWYLSEAARRVETLQVITVGGDYDAASADKTRNQRIEVFDFAQLVQQFDAARATNAVSDDGWSVMNGLLDAHLQGSDTAALGGDLSYQYATTGSLSGIGLAAAQSSLAAGMDWQTLKNRSQLEQGSLRLM